MDMPRVEPVDGPELDRLIMALLNITGVVKTIIEATPAAAEDDPDGLTVIDDTAAELRLLLAPVAEHHDDEELAYVRQFLAISTVVVADALGIGDVFRLGDELVD
jgi:hypothetical protein